MGAEKILIVEDDQHIAKLVKYNLEKAGFHCASTVTGEDALEILDRQTIDLIILDVMLPKMDGLELCKYIRQRQDLNHIPIVVMTARGEEVDRIVGFELGADDYVVKPFSPRELLLRVKAILRRGREETNVGKNILSVGKIVIDIPRHKVSIEKKSIELSPMEFKLLVILIDRKGRVQTRENLLTDVWGLSVDVTTRTVDTHVKLLRQKLGKEGKLIKTVHGMGYKIDDED